MGGRDIAASGGKARATIYECLARAEAVGVAWPLPEGWGEAGLDAKLFPPIELGDDGLNVTAADAAFDRRRRCALDTRRPDRAARVIAGARPCRQVSLRRSDEIG